MSSTPAPENLPAEPSRDCPLCPRLVAFREEWRAKEPDWHNAPVPTLLPPSGAGAVRLLIAGLAPGLRGANRTGRPFTGDYAGDLLYATLARYGFANDRFAARTDDGLELIDTAIVNAVRCVPPQNKPVGAEINTCRQFFSGRMATFPKLAAVVTLGRIAHDSTVRALGERPSAAPFGHNAHHMVGGIAVFSSYHCSRYNTNTGRLTEAMFHDVFENAAAFLKR
ncbi:uracil-DNA glycosylase [Aurantimonas manganoxydans SI85-9A1]|uniref:Type-5 uracil-DNA glycosylase n=1 Tax=Aurantimonas manganoxydans (strain ATCC BAA-1229 / DSM 21871 / SI85-9A1) TaxID=287752 RepID=Q1YEI9_AURMS|nr:uracil-DNA glycosylase [Aurantimonas manganoxydans]EAS48602.1 uracil-DNA glycosylase [Aurantimonas manganoxydans SI85-9A1]